MGGRPSSIMCLSTRSSNQARRPPSESCCIPSLISIPRPSRQGKTVPRYMRKGSTAWLAFTCSSARSIDMEMTGSSSDWRGNNGAYTHTRKKQRGKQKSGNDDCCKSDALADLIVSFICTFHWQGYMSHQDGEHGRTRELKAAYKQVSWLFKIPPFK